MNNMKTIWQTAGLILGVAAIAAAQAPPAAPGPTPNKVGVIAIQTAIQGTKDGQAAAADLETRLGPRRKELEKQQNEIKDLQEKVQRGGNTLSASAKDDMQRQIDTKTKSFNRDVEDAQAEYEQESQKAINELGGKLVQVIERYAQQNGYSVILDVSNPNTPVLYASTAVDITKEIIDLYDKAAPAPKSTIGSSPSAARPAATTPAPAKPPAVAPAKKQ